MLFFDKRVWGEKGFRVRQWHGSLEWGTLTLWQNLLFQIQFQEIVFLHICLLFLSFPTSTQGMGPDSPCTFHNRLIQLSIIPAERSVTLSLDPFLTLVPPFSRPLSSMLNSNTHHTLISYFIDLSPSLLPRLPKLSPFPVLQKFVRPSFNTGASQKENTMRVSVHPETNLNEHSLSGTRPKRLTWAWIRWGAPYFPT